MFHVVIFLCQFLSPQQPGNSDVVPSGILSKPLMYVFLDSGGVHWNWELFDITAYFSVV